MAVFVPDSLWVKIFIIETSGVIPMVAPFVEAFIFIGSPLATVLDANDVIFTGILGFVYSERMVPPLIAINTRYYGWRLALYIA